MILLRLFLRKVGADVAQLPKLTEGIGKLLKDNLPYMTAVHATGQAPGSTATMGGSTPSGTGGGRENVLPMNDNLIEFRAGTYLMRFPMDDTETAKTVISALLDKLSKSPQGSLSEVYRLYVSLPMYLNRPESRKVPRRRPSRGE